MTVRFDFTGQVALVTGASAGMGLATARAFAEAGASTVLVDIDETAVTRLAEELTGEGRDVLALAGDVSDGSPLQGALPRRGRQTAQRD